jgi:hypothetical protein
VPVRIAAFESDKQIALRNGSGVYLDFIDNAVFAASEEFRIADPGSFIHCKSDHK